MGDCHSKNKQKLMFHRPEDNIKGEDEASEGENYIYNKTPNVSVKEWEAFCGQPEELRMTKKVT